MTDKEEKVRENFERLKKEGKVILLKEKVTVTATEKNPYHKTGSKVTLHPDLAEKGIKDGFYTAVKAKKED